MVLSWNQLYPDIKLYIQTLTDLQGLEGRRTVLDESIQDVD